MATHPECIFRQLLGLLLLPARPESGLRREIKALHQAELHPCLHNIRDFLGGRRATTTAAKENPKCHREIASHDVFSRL